MQPMQDIVSLIGRLLISFIFIVSGATKIMNPDTTQDHMEHVGLPAVFVLYVCTIIIELGGGVLLALGYVARWVAVIVFLYLIPVTFTFHSPYAADQWTQFMKNLAIMGGLLMVVAFGPGRISVDVLSESREARRSEAQQPQPHANA